MENNHQLAPNNVNILILEDETSIAESLQFVLKAEGFKTHWLALASQAVSYVKENDLQLLIMDVGLPDMSGFEACKQIRQFSQVPVIFLTARGDEVDRVVGLEIGGDDYVVKPFSPREVVARVKAILKRVVVQAPETETESKDLDEEFVVNSEQKTISYRQQKLALTAVEFKILARLIENPERVLSREQLLGATGNATGAGYDRTIDGHIKSIRAKLRDVCDSTDAIQTIRGFGYAYKK